MAAIKKRLEIFNDLKAKGCFDDLTLDLQHAREIIRIMDTCKLNSGFLQYQFRIILAFSGGSTGRRFRGGRGSLEEREN